MSDVFGAYLYANREEDILINLKKEIYSEYY